MTDTSISVIIPLWNGQAYIDACLDALLIAAAACPKSVEIIVVDNASKDDSAQRVAERFPQVRLIQNERNLGFAGGCNVGLRAARGQYLAVLNQDTEVHPTWLATLVQALNEGAHVLGCLALLPDGVTVQHAGGVIDWPTGVARHLGYGERLAPQWQKPTDAEFVTAAAMAFPRRLLDDVGLFDELFWPGYYEDVDFCFRAREAGYSVRYLPDAILMHQEHASFRNRQMARWAQLRGRLRFCLKHRTPAYFIEQSLPAEERLRSVTLNSDRKGAIALAYLEVIPMMVEIWQGRASSEEICEAARRLQALYAPPPFHVYEDNSVDKWILPGDKRNHTSAAKPILRQSWLDRIPVIGGVALTVRRAFHQLIWFYVERRRDRLDALLQEQAEQIESLQAALDALEAERQRD